MFMLGFKCFPVTSKVKLSWEFLFPSLYSFCLIVESTSSTLASYSIKRNDGYGSLHLKIIPIKEPGLTTPDTPILQIPHRKLGVPMDILDIKGYYRDPYLQSLLPFQ